MIEYELSCTQVLDFEPMELIIVSSLPFSRLKTLKNINFVNLLNQIILASNIARTRAHNFDRKRSNLFISIISGNFLFLALIFLLFIAKVHPSLPSNKNQVPVFAPTLFFCLDGKYVGNKTAKIHPNIWQSKFKYFWKISSLRLDVHPSRDGKSSIYALMFIPQVTQKSSVYALMFIPQVTQKSSVYALMFIPRGTIVPNSLIHSDSRTWRHTNKLHCIV